MGQSNEPIHTLKYKGYEADIYRSEEDKCFHGKLKGIRDLVNFEGNSILRVTFEFRKAVNDYLAFCKQVGKEPETPKLCGTCGNRGRGGCPDSACFMAKDMRNWRPWR